MKKYLKIVFCLLLLTSTAFAVKTFKIIQTFNAGELSPLMDARKDQQKYIAGCRTLENFIPLIYGGAQRRPGTEYIATQKSSSAKGRLVAFEHSVDDTYILLFENQVIRFFTDSAQVLDGAGTEDLSGVDGGALVAHWLLNEIDGTNVENADNPGTHDGTASADISSLTVTGKVGTGAFDLDNQYNVTIPDNSVFSFDDSGSNPFSLVCWGNVTDKGAVQVLLSKWDETTGSVKNEWRLSLNSDRKLQLHLSDTSVNLDSDRVAQWKLNDDAGTTAVDDDVASVPHDGVASANTNTLTATGQIGKCFDFGGSAFVTVTDHAALSFGNGTVDSPFSIAAWAFVTVTGNVQTILSKKDTDGKEWDFNLTSEKLRFILTDQSVTKSVIRESDDTLTPGWHFVVGTYPGQSTEGATAANLIKLYVDGSLVNSTATNNASYDAMESLTQNVLISARNPTSPTNFFADKIDNVVLFDIELTLANIQALYNSGDGTETTGTAKVFVISDDVIDLGWHFFVSTYDSTGGSTAADGIILYVDGAVVSSTATNDATYTAMQNGASLVRIGAQESTGGAASRYWNDKIDEVSVFSDVLTPTEVASLYSTTPFELTTSYLTADLPTLKFEQSADVMYITHPSYEPRRLSRIGDVVWTLAELDLQDGPFRDQNTDTSLFIVASATTGNITLTATGTGNNPFVSGTTAGHEPSGSADTSKSKTGALFRLVQATDTPSVSGFLVTNDATDNFTSELAVPKGVTWDLTTNGTWGTAANSATIQLEREYGNSAVWEAVVTVTSAANRNVVTNGTEDFSDAQYRVSVTEAGGDTSEVDIQLSIRDTSHIGIVEITSVTSSTVAIGTVLTTLASTDKTHRWSEGSFSNLRGWPIDVKISSEERLTFAGNISEPLTTWGSVVDNWTSFAEGTLDTDAIIFTLIGSGQQNRIRWLVSKDSLFLGTVGGEHLLGASKVDEALTPTNARARLQTTYGSENISALIVNQAILFVQRGGKKIREFLYNFDADAHKADDLTVFSEHITGDGIVDMTYQRTPDPTLWCIRTDGEIAIMTYERDQKVFSWSRIFTNTNLAGTSTKSVIESAAVIFGGTRSEDEVWITVNRQISGTDARYVERFFQRAMPSSVSDMKFLDSYITDTGGDTTITGLSHLEGQTVQVLGDGLVQATKVVSSGSITAATTASKYQVGLGYTSTLKPMKLDIADLGLATTKRINKAIVNVFETIGGEVGTSTSDFEDIPTGTGALATDHYEISMPGGYSREGDIIIRQTQPLPMTALSLTLEVGIGSD